MGNFSSVLSATKRVMDQLSAVYPELGSFGLTGGMAGAIGESSLISVTNGIAVRMAVLYLVNGGQQDAL